MRLLGCLITAACISLLHGPCARAQAADEHSPAGASEPAPAHQHRDHHHGHDQIYPDRGAIFHELPHGAVAVYHAGLPYKFFNGIWYEQHGQAFIVVAPAIGAVVTALPASVTPVENGKDSYLYANDVFYQARPDLGGYEVVNDPDEVIPPAAAKNAPNPPAASPTATPAAPAADPAVPAVTAPAPTVNPVVPAAVTAAAVTAAAAGGAAATPAVATALPAATAIPTAAVVNPQAAAASGAPRGAKVVATPKNGQSPDVQARDHYECYKVAVAHSGFDPMHVNGASVTTQVSEQQSDYERTQAACFEGRGYSIQ